MTKTDDISKLKQHLSEQGVYVTKAIGRSMLPMIRSNQDVLVIENFTADSSLKKGDILLYQGLDGKLTLHRFYALDGEKFLLNGDNCAFWERIDRQAVIGRLTTYYRKDKEKSLSGSLYQLYLHLWIYPWRLRFAIKRAYRFLKRLLGGLRGRLK